MKTENKYDVVIVGAGIGGLTCGCYLAKKGIKVLIIEQQSRVGGYCGSFKRNNYTFDIGVHYFGSFRKKGFMDTLYNELSLNDYVKISRFDPTDILVFPDFKVNIKTNISETIEELKNIFPEQYKNIDLFFNFILKARFEVLYTSFRNMTMSHILNKYFNNNKLKAFFNILLGNIGLASSSVSAVAASIMFRDYVFDGGYYTKGGTQTFVDAFAKVFKKFNGHLVVNKKVKKILLTSTKNIYGVGVDSEDSIQAKYIVLNSNPRNMRFETTHNKEIKVFENHKRLIPSCSAFIIYIGLNQNLKTIYKNCHNVWYSPTYNQDIVYSKKNRKNLTLKNDFVFCSIPSLHDTSLAPEENESGHIIVLTTYGISNYLHENKDYIADSLIKRVEKIMPKFSKYIKTRAIATPYTLERYTSNCKGALYGWASTPEQSNRNEFPMKTDLNKFYIVGHWATLDSGQGGITMSAYTGKQVARNILREITK